MGDAMRSDADAGSERGAMRPSLRWVRQCVATDAALGLSSVRLGVPPPIAARAVPSVSEHAPEPESLVNRPSAARGDLTQAGLQHVAAPSPRAPQSAPNKIPGLRAGVEIETLTSTEAKQAALDRLRERHDRECPHCTTATSHTRTVFGEGDCNAELMFVGEAPGETEDQLGRPFVGKAGQKLDEMIAAMGMARSQVYIANVLKSRPPENRTPLQHEVEGCGPYLVEQIRIIRPRVIVTLGGPATKLLLATELGITRLRGIWSAFEVVDPPATERDGSDIASSMGGFCPTPRSIPVMPTFHPAYVLRNYTPETRRMVWSDLQAALGKLRALRDAAPSASTTG